MIAKFIDNESRVLWITIFNMPIVGRIPVLREYLGLGFVVSIFFNYYVVLSVFFDFVSTNFFPHEFFFSGLDQDPRFPKFKPFSEPYGGRKTFSDLGPKIPSKAVKQPDFNWAIFWSDVKKFISTTFTVENFNKTVETILINVDEALTSDDKPMNQIEEDWADAWRMHYIKIIQDRHSSREQIHLAKLELEAQIRNEQIIFENRGYIELVIIVAAIATAFFLLDDKSKPISLMKFCWDVKIRVLYKRFGIDLPVTPP